MKKKKKMIDTQYLIHFDILDPVTKSIQSRITNGNKYKNFRVKSRRKLLSF